MKQATFRFYEELNDFLPKKRRKISFTHSFVGNPSIKDVIESLGVSHAEIDLILVNGISVDFNYQLQDQDKVSVYPVFEAIDITPITHLRPRPLRDNKFILDSHLGRLAKYLRICGFDSLYENHFSDEQIVVCALQEQRIILTKDRGLLKNKRVTHGYWVRTTNPKQQLIEIITRFDLIGKIQFLIRCLLCNTKLVSIKKAEIQAKLPEKTIQYYDEFFLCPSCKRVYWKGSHYENMNGLIKFIKSKLNVNEPS
jgi:uncharacterized protein with PIN domain